MKTTIERIPAEALKFHFGDDASVCEFAEGGEDGKTPVKIKARSRGPIPHWYWGMVIHDMAGMKLSKKHITIDYCHREDEVLGALDSFDTESGDLQAQGFLDDEDARASEIIRKRNKGVSYEASIFFDRRTVEAERLSDRETATVNGVTVRGPVTIIRKWTLRGVAICPYGYDPKTSTRFSDGEGDVEVTMFSKESEEGGSTMSVEQETNNAGELSETAAGGEQTQTQTPNSATELSTDNGHAGGGTPSGKETELSEEAAEEPPANPPEGSTELGAGSETSAEEKTAPGQAFIDRFGLEKGSQYFARGLSIDEASAEHFQAVEKENSELKARLEAAATAVGSEEPVSFSGEGAGAADTETEGTGDEALDAFCAHTKLPGQRS